MEADRTGLLLALLSEDAGSPSLVQRLVMLVDAATLNPEGRRAAQECMHAKADLHVTSWPLFMPAHGPSMACSSLSWRAQFGC